MKGWPPFHALIKLNKSWKDGQPSMLLGLIKEDGKPPRWIERWKANPPSMLSASQGWPNLIITFCKHSKKFTMWLDARNMLRRIDPNINDAMMCWFDYYHNSLVFNISNIIFWWLISFAGIEIRTIPHRDITHWLSCICLLSLQWLKYSTGNSLHPVQII